VKERNEAVGRPHRKHVTAALVSDQDDGQTAGYDLPEPTVLWDASEFSPGLCPSLVRSEGTADFEFSPGLCPSLVPYRGRVIL
jgi:hypothetical protein